ncbi:MAG: HD domain-containing protein, partial [Methanomassiliicoccaceae archaeon]|nr:HD domain-containing protein [Methanomassiliicoccaceae archaeon]
SSEIMRSLIRRQLYKKAYSAYSIDLDEDQINKIARYANYDDRKRLEDEIAEEAGIDYSKVIVDIPSRSSLYSKLKIGKTDVLIFDDGRVRPITRMSPVAKALQSRNTFDWAVMVSAPAEFSERVGKVTSSVLSL